MSRFTFVLSQKTCHRGKEVDKYLGNIHFDLSILLDKLSLYSYTVPILWTGVLSSRYILFLPLFEGSICCKKIFSFMKYAPHFYNYFYLRILT